MAAIETSVDRSGFRMQPTSRSPPVSSGVLPSADTSTDIHARASMDRAESRTSSTYTSMRPLSAFQPLEMGVEANRPSSQMLHQDTRHASNSSSVSSSMPQLTFKSADLRSALHLHEAQKHKLYMEGYLLVRHALSVDGQPAHRPDQFRSWTECFVQLNGTILSIWESSALAKAESEGREVPPSFVNITDAMVDFIGLHVEAQFSEPGRRRALYHVFAVNSAGSNRILFCYSTPPPCESSLVEQRLSAKYQNHPDQERVVNWLNTGHRFLQAWINAMRLASWERSRLDEIYTGALIRARLSAVRNMQGTTMQQSDDHAELLVRSPLLRGRHEGYVRARFMGSTEWRMCWMVLQSHWSEDEPVSGIRRLLKRNAGDRSSLLSLGSHSHQGNGMSDAQEPPPPPDKSIASPAVAYFYDSKKAKKPFASLWHVRNVYAVYPSRPDLVEGSILFKVEGCLPQSTVLSATHRPRKTGWVMFMPEVKHSHVGQANAEMMKWIIAFMDAFHLYGRPGAFAWDARNPVSPFFAYPIGPYKDHLFLDRALAEFLDVTIEDHLSTRQELHDIMAARMRGENTMLLPPLPMQSPTTVSRQPTQVARAVHAEVQAAREAQQIPTTPGGYQDAYYALTGSQDAPPPSLPSVSSPVTNSARLPQDSSTSESKQQVAVPSNMQSTQDTSAVASSSFAQATNPDLMSHADAEHQVQQQMDAIAHAQAQEEYEAQRQALAKLEQEAEAQAQAKARAQAELEAHNRSVQQQTARLQAEQLAKSQGDREASSRRHYDQQLLQEQQAKERTRAEFSARTSLDLKHAGHVPINTPRTQPLTVSASAFQSRQRPGANTNVALADEGQERAVIGENAVNFAGGNAVASPMAEPAAASSTAVPAATAFAALPKAQSAQFTPAQYLPTESSVPKSATEEPQHRPPLQLNQLSLDESHLSTANHSNEHRLPTNNASSTSASVLKPAIRTTSSGVASTAPTSISLSVSRSDINHAGTSLQGPQVYNPRHEQVYPWPIRRESQENSVNVDDSSIVSQVNSDFHATNQYTELSPINEQLTDPPSAKPSSHSNYSTSTMRPAEQYSATSKNPFSAASLQSFSLKSSKQSPTTTPLSPALPSNLSFLAPTATFPGQNPSQSTTVHQQRVPSEQLSNRILDEYFDDLQASHTNASAPATHAVVTPISARKQLDDEPNPSLAADGTEHQPYEDHGENARLTAQLDDDLDEDQDVYGDPNAPSTQSMYPSSFGHKSNAAINATHTIAQSRPGRPMHVSNSNGSQDWVDHDESDWSRSMTQDPATQRETDSGPNLRKSVGKSPYRNGTPTIPPSDSHGNLTSSERNGVSSITPSQSQRMSLAPIAPAMTLNASTTSLGEEMPQSQSQSQLHSYTTPFPRPTSGFAGSYARSNHSASSLGLYQNKAGSSSSLHLDRPRATFVKLDHEDPRLAKQKYMPQGLLASASQERLDRRAQDHESRSNGAVLVNMPPKPPPPQAGLMGAIHGRSQTGSSPDRRSESAPNSTRLGASSAGNMTPSASQQQMMMNMYYWQQQQQMMMMMMGGGMMPANREQYPMQAQQQAMQAAQQAYMQALAQANGGNISAGMPAGMPTGMPAGMPTGMPNFYGMPNYADPSWSRPMTSSSSRDSFLSAPPRMSVAESRTSRTSPRSSPRSSHHGR